MTRSSVSIGSPNVSAIGCADCWVRSRGTRAARRDGLSASQSAVVAAIAPAAVGEPELRESLVDDPGGVVHLAVADEMQGSSDHPRSVGSPRKTPCHNA